MNVFALIQEIKRAQSAIVKERVAKLTDEELLSHIDTIQSMTLSSIKVASNGLESSEDDGDIFGAIYQEAMNRKLIAMDQNCIIYHLNNQDEVQRRGTSDFRSYFADLLGE